MVGTNLQTLLNNHEYAVVMSACVYGCHETDNELATQHMNDLIDATGLRYTPAIGCYEGNQEPSFIVLCDSIYDVMRLECMAIHLFHQECVLILDMHKECAMLKYADKTCMIGRALVPIDMLAGNDNYTIVDGELWVVD
jgi:hypothetical protein